jgi:hypothetical protein
MEVEDMMETKLQQSLRQRKLRIINELEIQYESRPKDDKNELQFPKGSSN